jgi:Recombination endonuclease VII
MVSPQAIWQKRRYWEDPAYRAKILERARAYRKAHGDEINKRLRERRRNDPQYRQRRIELIRAYWKAHKSELNARERERRRTDPEYGERDHGNRTRRRYGLPGDGYDALLARQGGGCAICRRKPTRRRLAVDHCHARRRIRALLCARCNPGLGQFDDDPRRLLVAIAYLEASRRGPVTAAEARRIASKTAERMRRVLERALRAQFALRRATSRSSESSCPPPGSSRRPARRRSA